MATPFQYTSPGTKTLLIAGDTSTPTLKNLASGALILSTTTINTRKDFIDLALRVRGASAFAAGATVIAWWIIDIGNAGAFSDGDASTTPARQPDLIWNLRAVSTQQVVVLRNVWKPNPDSKILLANNTAVAFTNTDNENQLHYSEWNYENP